MADRQQTDQPAAKNGLTFDGDPRRQYLFAYGADMHPEQIRERCSRPVALGPARLPGYAIGFYGHSDIWDGAVETAVPTPGSALWGVLYELTFTDALRLDEWHDARLDGAGSFFHFPVRVESAGGELRTALLYKKDVLGAPQPPSREYLDFIVQGALERGLPQAYTEALRRTATREAAYAVPQHSEMMRELRVVTSCTECGG